MGVEPDLSPILDLLSSQFQLEKLMPALLDLVIQFTGAERGFLMLLDKDGSLDIKSARSLEKENLNEENFPGSHSIIRKVLEEKTSLYIPCLPVSESFASAPSVRAGNLQSVICIPLWWSKQTEDREQLLGILYIDSSSLLQGLFNEEHLRLAQALANHVAICIENAKLFQELESKNQEIAGLNNQLQKIVDSQAGRLVDIELLLNESQRELGKRYSLGTLIGKSPSMQKLFNILERVVSTDATVLIQGESGTGKELVAKYLHHHGPRANKTMISINCAAFNDTLLESELFGYRKGAFTGADRHKTGLFQLADAGTLFLDEVGDMSLEMQKKFLRVLQYGEIRPIGGEDTFHVNVRIIAASNRNLRDRIEEGKFREDLYFRLNVIQIQIPPLRERREDLPLLIDHFTKTLTDELNRSLTPPPDMVFQKYLQYYWPGNIRELENELRRFFILGTEYRFEIPTSSSGVVNSYDLNVLEKNTILRALDATDGNKTRAAELLGIPLRTLYDRLKKLEIEPKV